MAAGEHLLTGRELVDTVKFPDAIAAGNYEIDIHNPEGSGTSHYYFPAGEYYTVPYRSLVVRDADNLLVAGRCISCDHEAQASVRIMPICCATGQAAGTAAGKADAGRNCRNGRPEHSACSGCVGRSAENMNRQHNTARRVTCFHENEGACFFVSRHTL